MREASDCHIIAGRTCAVVSQIVCMVSAFGSCVCLQNSTVLYYISCLRINMYCYWGGYSTCQLCIFQRYIQCLFVVVDTVPDITGVRTVFECCAGIIDLFTCRNRILAHIIDGVACYTRVTCIVWFYQLYQDTIVSTFGIAGEIYICIVHYKVAVSFVCLTGFNLHQGIFGIYVTVFQCQSTAACLLCHKCDTVRIHIGIVINWTWFTGCKDLYIVWRVETYIAVFIPYTGIRIGYISGTAHGVSVSHTVYNLCCSIFLCSLCHFYCTDTRNRIIYLKCICTGVVVRCSGICGQSTPSCGNDHTVVVDCLACTKYVCCTDGSLHTKCEWYTFHHGWYQFAICTIVIICLLGIDDRVIYCSLGAISNPDCSTNGSRCIDIRIINGYICILICHDSWSPSWKIITTVTVGSHICFVDRIFGISCYIDTIKMCTVWFYGYIVCLSIRIITGNRIQNRPVLYNFSIIYK